MSAPKLIVCSHRGPYEYRRVRGRLEGRRGGGGLIGAVTPVLEHFGGHWIAAPMSPGDREFIAADPSGRDEGGFRLRLLDLPEQAHRNHYDVVSNEHLWFLCHYLFDVAETPAFDDGFARAWEDYRMVNRTFADAVASNGDADAILVEDYHLMLVGAGLRDAGVTAPISYFHHTPWPEADYFMLLPPALAGEILAGLLACDVVGFHAGRWARAFLHCCEQLLPDAKVAESEVVWKDHTTKVVVAPVPLDIERLRQEAAHERTQRLAEELESQRADRKLLVRIDRIDLSKNPIRGYLAFEQLLRRRPEMAQDVWFLALQYPSRLGVERYRRYLADCLEVVQRVNDEFAGRSPGAEGPIGFHFKDDFHQSLAAMRLFDTILVNPVFDGLNLVAKESVTLNERDGALVLSRNAGAYEELGDHALVVNPFDVSETADAIERALETPAAERAQRLGRLRDAVARTTPEGWVRARLAPVGIAL